MKSIYTWAAALGCMLLLASCNDEWTDEQYEKYLSFVHPGETNIYLKYDAQGGKKTHRIPVQVVGSQISGHDIKVDIAIDNDTLAKFNYDNFHSREDLFVKQLAPAHYKFNEMSAVIPGGDVRGYVDVEFSLEGLDTYDRHILPLAISSSSDLVPNPNKHFGKSLITINPFNDYSGQYMLTSEFIEYDDNGNERPEKIKVEYRTGKVVDESTIFFFVGMVDETALNRREFIVYAKFIPRDDNPNKGEVELYTENPDLDLQVQNCHFDISEEMDGRLPYLKRRYVVIDVDYTFWDRSSDFPAKFKYKGNMIMQRSLNILMPEEDQIMWN